MTESKTKAFLMDNPKLLAALFGMTMLMSQMGAVAAGHGSTVSGP